MTSKSASGLRMNKAKVALVRCNEYGDDLVYKAVKKGINLLGGISSFVTPNENIVLKPNVLIGTDPSKSVTTHPTVFKAVGGYYKRRESIARTVTQVGLANPSLI